ncbi:MAG TPA: HD-GYP domain-containing protein [Anaerolineales bacterium]|nr:HD-GYP domain-containing protein [Anaerolineales bacterium]
MSNNLSLYEKNQRVRTLAAIIWIVLMASVALGFLNIQFRTWDSVIALFSLAFICVILLWLNSSGQYTLSALILSIVVLMVINLNLYDGDGIRDSGILAYPIFIMMGILFFGKRATLYFSLATIASLIGIVTLEIHGYIHPTIGATNFDILLPIIILLLAVTAFIWVVVGNTEGDLERVKDSEVELRKNYDLTLESWAKVLEYRDKETEGHSRRLVELSTRLAQELGLTPEAIGHLRHGALLHDIGKLAIPDEILLKPGALNDVERRTMEQHPAYAKQMLAQVVFLQPCVEVAYSHHERWDGLGYPQGLKGEEIPLSARIFAVVDQWDALTSDRPYRKAWTKEKVIAYLQENAGKIYDPEIVNVFLKII